MGRFRTLGPRPASGTDEAGRVPPRATVDVQIEANAGGAAEYRLDAEKRPRLAAVHPPAAQHLPGDLGHVVDSADEAGEPLCAMVLGGVSVHPGAVVPGRVIGLMHPEGGERGWLVVIPVADPTLANVHGSEDLPGAVRERLRAFAKTQRVVWVMAEKAERTARQAIERGRRRGAELRAERAAADAAWRPTPGTERRWATFEGETHTQAELDLFRIPYRFQRYLREVLLPQERLLARVHRPPLALGRWPLRRQTEPEAIVLLTDQQLLVLSDARPPDRLLVLGGFVARATAVERIAAIRLQPVGEHAAQRLDLLSRRETAPWSILVPQGPDTDTLVRLAARFAPRPGEMLPARRGHVEPVDVDMTGWHAFFGADAAVVWRGWIAAALGADEPLLAWALTPAMPTDDSPATAVALTPFRLLAVGESGVRGVWPMGEVTSVELRSSPFASALRVWTTHAAPTLTVPFPFTVGPAFLDLFLAARRRLGAFPLA